MIERQMPGSPQNKKENKIIWYVIFFIAWDVVFFCIQKISWKIGKFESFWVHAIISFFLTLAIPYLFSFILPKIFNVAGYFYGSVRNLFPHAKVKETKTEKTFSLRIGQGTGILAQRGHLCNIKAGADLSLNINDACQNTIIFGGIGSGKTTRAINPILWQLLSQDCGGLIFDVKSDFWQTVDVLCQKTGRSVVKIGYKEGQVNLNLLKGLTPEVAASFIKSAYLMEGGSGGEPYWIESATNMALGALGVLYFIPGKYTMDYLYKYIFSDVGRDELKKEAENIFDLRNENLDVDDIEAIQAFTYDQAKFNSYMMIYDNHFANLDSKTKGIIESTVSTVLVNFNQPDIKKAFCTDSDFEMKNVLDGTIFLVDLPIPQFGTVAKISYMWIKLLLFNIMQQRPGRKEWNQKRPVFFMCDEYQDVIACSKSGLSDLTFWDKSRSAKMIGVISAQAVDSFYAAINNKDVANTIISNFRQKIVFKTENKATMEMLNSILGKVEIQRVSHTSGSSTSHGSILSNSSSSSTTSTIERLVLDANMVRQLNQDQAVCLCLVDGLSYDDVCNMQPLFVNT